MSIITIPEKFAKGDLVLVPKRDYQEFSQWKKNIRIRLDERWFWTREWQKKEADADRAIQNEKIEGPFDNSKELLAALKSKREKK